MNNQRGITLISLIVTIIVLVIIATITTYSGIESIDITKQQVFISELEMIQAKVSAIYEKRKSSETQKEYYDNLGKDLSTISSSKVDSALNGEASSGYKYFSKTDLKQIELENITQDVLINFDTRSVVSLNGISIDGTVYYRLKDIPTYTGQNIEYTDKNTEAPNFEVKIEPLKSSWNMKIQNVQYKGNVYGGTFSYRSGLTLEEIENKPWIIFDGQQFEAKDPGIYQIKLVDKAGNETIVEQYAYVKNGLYVYYDGENNTGDGHSSTTTIWKDLSGNGNDGSIYGIDANSWKDDYLYLDGINDYISKNDIIIDGKDGTIELIAHYISGPYMFRSNASGARTYIWGHGTMKGNPGVTTEFKKRQGYQESVASRILKYYTDRKNESYEVAYFNNNKSEEAKFNGTDNGSFIVIGAFWPTSPDQLASMNTYAIRIYNRALTDEEIKINYQIDKYRFNIIE